LLAAEHDGELLLPRRTHQIPERPVTAQSALEEELDPAQRDGEAGTGEVLHVGQVEEVLPQLFFGNPVRRPVEMRGELTDGVDVGRLGSGREPAELPYPRSCADGVASWPPLSGRGKARPDQDAPWRHSLACEE